MVTPVLSPEPPNTVPVLDTSKTKIVRLPELLHLLDTKTKLLLVDGDESKAVILSITEYCRLVEDAGHHQLDELRHRFEGRLRELKRNDAGERLRAIMRNPGELNGVVKAGSSSES